MKIIFHQDFYQVYTNDPAAERGRLESIVGELWDKFDFVDAVPATLEDIAAVHTPSHIDDVKGEGIYPIAALAAGGAIQAAQIGLTEPAFAVIRPPGHHASAGSAWGFCFFNNMAVAITKLKNEGAIKKALILDIDLHFGDGTVNILGSSGYVDICNPVSQKSSNYVSEIEQALAGGPYDIIGISAGFDNALLDWGGVLDRPDYVEIGCMVRRAAGRTGAGYFAVLEGGYNHKVLGDNALALLEGMDK
ncbi:MAG: histone deacetylase family protein [Deltaproteobacteria bacterium]|nr:histone deacetylase family protein [Deltaproteobacteria bacterium]